MTPIIIGLAVLYAVVAVRILSAFARRFDERQKGIGTPETSLRSRSARAAIVAVAATLWPVTLLALCVVTIRDDFRKLHADQPVPGGPVEPLTPQTLEEAAFPQLNVPVPWFDKQGQEAMNELTARMGVHPLIWMEQDDGETASWLDAPEGAEDRRLTASVLALDPVIPKESYRRIVWSLAVNYAAASTVASQYMAKRSAEGASEYELEELEELRAKMRRACLLFNQGVELADNSKTGGPVLESLLNDKFEPGGQAA